MVLTVNAIAAQSASSHRYIRQMAGPRVIVGASAGAGVSHLRNSPHEWGRGVSGFGKRVGSALGTHALKTGIELSVATARHEQLSYQPLRRGSTGKRLRHALVSTVITRKTTTGQRTVASGRISGAIGSGLISRVWQPASAASLSTGFATAGMSLGADAGAHVAREFWPQRKHSTVATQHAKPLKHS